MCLPLVSVVTTQVEPGHAGGAPYRKRGCAPAPGRAGRRLTNTTSGWKCRVACCSALKLLPGNRLLTLNSVESDNPRCDRELAHVTAVTAALQRVCRVGHALSPRRTSGRTPSCHNFFEPYCLLLFVCLFFSSWECSVLMSESPQPGRRPGCADRPGTRASRSGAGGGRAGVPPPGTHRGCRECHACKQRRPTEKSGLATETTNLQQNTTTLKFIHEINAMIEDRFPYPTPKLGPGGDTGHIRKSDCPFRRWN